MLLVASTYMYYCSSYHTATLLERIMTVVREASGRLHSSSSLLCTYCVRAPHCGHGAVDNFLLSRLLLCLLCLVYLLFLILTDSSIVS